MSCVIWGLLGTYIIVIVILWLDKDSIAIASSRYLSSYHVIFFIERYFAIAGGDRCTRASGRTSADSSRSLYRLYAQLDDQRCQHFGVLMFVLLEMADICQSLHGKNR